VKGQNLDDIRNAIRAVQGARIHIHGMFVLVSTAMTGGRLRPTSSHPPEGHERATLPLTRLFGILPATGR
jgi:hypothetical protein